jgi:hypothetical protein
MWKSVRHLRIAVVTTGVAIGWQTALAQAPPPVAPAATSALVSSSPKNDPTPIEVQKLTGPVFLVNPQSTARSAQEAGLAQFFIAALWPVTILGLACLLAYSARIGRILGLSPKIIKKISAGGVEMEISADAVDAVRSQLRDSFDELIKNADQEYKRMAQLMNLYLHLQRVTMIALPRALQENDVEKRAHDLGVRATIHVKDIVLSEHFYQIVDYYPTRFGGAAIFTTVWNYRSLLAARRISR